VAVPLPGTDKVPLVKLAVTPEGMEDAESVTAELNPLATVVVKFTPPVAPIFTVTVDDAAASAKLGGGTTVSETGAVCCMPPPLPVTLTAYVPPTALEAAANVTTELPLPGAARLVFDSVAVTPLGKPATLSATAALNPFVNVLVSVTGAVPPPLTVAAVADAFSENAGDMFTIIGRLMVCL
jgi:hypothetical protein